MIEIEARLSELRAMGLWRRIRLVSGPQGPHVVLDGKPVLLLCSDNYLGLADHPRVREAAADAAMRWGVGAAASRLASGTMTVHRRLEERLAAFAGRRERAAVRLAPRGQRRRDRRPGPAGRRGVLRRGQSRVADRRLPALARRRVRLRPRRRRAPGLGAGPGPGAGGADRHRVRVLPRRRRGPARGPRRARPASPGAPAGRRSPRHRHARPGRSRCACRVRAGGSGRRHRRDARQVSRLARRLRGLRPRDDPVPLERRAHGDLLDRSGPAGGGRCAGRPRPARGAAPPGRQAPAGRGDPAGRPPGRGLRPARVDHPPAPDRGRRPRTRRCGCASWPSPAACSPTRSCRPPSPPRAPGCAWP